MAAHLAEQEEKVRQAELGMISAQVTAILMPQAAYPSDGIKR